MHEQTSFATIGIYEPSWPIRSEPLGREEILEKVLCCESRHKSRQSEFIGPDIYPLERGKLILPEVLVHMAMNMDHGTLYLGFRYQLFKILEDI